MIIGNIDIAAFNAKQRSASFSSHNSISNSSEWVSGAVLPFLADNRIGFKDLQLTLWVYGNSRAAIVANCSNILAALMKPCDLTLDGYTNKFHGVMRSYKHEEKVVNRWHILTINFECYEFGTDVMVTGTSSVTVANPGNVRSPCVVELTSSKALSAITLTGLCKDSFTGTDIPVQIANILKNTKITIDGITGLVTEGNGLKKMNLWALPAMDPGNTTVTCDSGYVTIKVTTTPLYF